MTEPAGDTGRARDTFVRTVLADAPAFSAVLADREGTSRGHEARRDLSAWLAFVVAVALTARRRLLGERFTILAPARGRSRSRPRAPPVMPTAVCC